MGLFGTLRDEFGRLAKTEDEIAEDLDEREEYEDYGDYDESSYGDEEGYGYDYDDDYEEEKPRRERFSFGFGKSKQKRERRSFAFDAEEQEEQEAPETDDGIDGNYGSRDYASASASRTSDYSGYSSSGSASSGYTSAANSGRSSNTSAGASAGQGRRRANNVVDFNAGASQQVKVFHPKEFRDGTEYADCLRANQTVVLNLEETSPDLSRRVTDFVAGAAFALGGKVSSVSSNTVVATPSTIDIVGDRLGTLLDNPLVNQKSN